MAYKNIRPGATLNVIFVEHKYEHLICQYRPAGQEQYVDFFYLSVGETIIIVGTIERNRKVACLFIRSGKLWRTRFKASTKIISKSLSRITMRV